MQLHKFGITNRIWDDLMKQNENIDMIQNALTGALFKNVSGQQDVALSEMEATNGLIVFTGTLTNNVTAIVPCVPRVYHVQNQTSGDYTLTIKTEAGDGVPIQRASLPNYPRIKRVLCDGSNIVWADGDQIVEDNLHEATPDAGYYIRYANGVQVCFGSTGEQFVTTSSYQSGYRSDSYLFPFPQPFISLPAVTVTAGFPGNYGIWIFPRGDAAQWGYRAMSFDQQTDRSIGGVRFMAIGRWK